MGYRPGRHPNSLAALKPARKGEVRNPEGINGSTREREAWRIAAALAEAIANERDPERRAELMERLVERWFNGAIGGDHRLLYRLFDWLMPAP